MLLLARVFFFFASITIPVAYPIPSITGFLGIFLAVSQLFPPEWEKSAPPLTQGLLTLQTATLIAAIWLTDFHFGLSVLMVSISILLLILCYFPRYK